MLLTHLNDVILKVIFLELNESKYQYHKEKWMFAPEETWGHPGIFLIMRIKRY